MKRMYGYIFTVFCLSAPLHAASMEAPIQVGSHTIENTKNAADHHNEDRILLGQIEEDSVFAIFDGHGGSRVSTMLADGFVQALEERLSGKEVSESSVQLALREVFFWFHAKSVEFQKEGSTAAVAYYLKKQRKIIIAHAGDSRILIFTPENHSLYATSDHTASSLTEKTRLDTAMGFPGPSFPSTIMYTPRGGWRFGFNLATARSIGDRGVIQSVLFYSTSPSTDGIYEERLFQIYAEPTITVVGIAGPVFLLAASDGLFDGIAARYPTPQARTADSDEEAKDLSAEEIDRARLKMEHTINEKVRGLVFSQWTENQNVHEVAKKIAELAKTSQNGWHLTSDDISIILAKIDS